MKILGIDPGSSRVGFGLIETAGERLTLKQAGCLEIAGRDRGLKLLALAGDFKKLLARTKPDLVALEKLFFTKNIKTGIEVAQARGVLALLTLQYGARLVEFSPQEVKQTVTNYGNADKKAVAKMIRFIVSLPPSHASRTALRTDDATDAVALAITAARINSDRSRSG